MEKKIKIVRAASLGAIAAAIFIAASTVMAELFAPFKDFLKEKFSHHWVGKSVLALLIFLTVSFLGYFILKKSGIDSLPRILLILGLTAVFGSFLILGFFIYEYLK